VGYDPVDCGRASSSLFSRPPMSSRTSMTRTRPAPLTLGHLNVSSRVHRVAPLSHRTNDHTLTLVLFIPGDDVLLVMSTNCRIGLTHRQSTLYELSLYLSQHRALFSREHRFLYERRVSKRLEVIAPANKPSPTRPTVLLFHFLHLMTVNHGNATTEDNITRIHTFVLHSVR